MNKKYFYEEMGAEIDEAVDYFYSEMLSNLEEADMGEVFDKFDN